MKYLIDTDKLIDFLHGKEDVVEAMKKLIPEGVAVSVVTICEYFYGAYMSTNPQREKELFLRFIDSTSTPVFDVDSNVAFRYSAVQAGLAKQGLKGGVFDVLVAATALEHRLILYTGNVKDFSKIKELPLA